MTRWLQAAKVASETDSTALASKPEKPVSSTGQRDNWDTTDKTSKATSNAANPIAESDDLSVVSVLSGVPSEKADVPPSAPNDVDLSPYGQTAGGRQLTWTGKVVSLDDWRGLSDQERHGKNAQHWNGITQKWETPA